MVGWGWEGGALGSGGGGGVVGGWGGGGGKQGQWAWRGIKVVPLNLKFSFLTPKAFQRPGLDSGGEVILARSSIFT